MTESADDRLFNDLVERDLFVELVACGVSEINAGFEVGWTPAQTRRNLADPSFADIVMAARDRANGTIEQALYELAKAKNLGAIQMWLYNRQPDRWKDVRKIEVKSEHTINVGAVLTTKQAILELVREQGAAALQPAPPAIMPAPGDGDGIIDADVIE